MAKKHLENSEPTSKSDDHESTGDVRKERRRTAPSARELEMAISEMAATMAGRGSSADHFLRDTIFSVARELEVLRDYIGQTPTEAFHSDLAEEMAGRMVTRLLVALDTEDVICGALERVTAFQTSSRSRGDGAAAVTQ
jgi:hypothetical protein